MGEQELHRTMDETVESTEIVQDDDEAAADDGDDTTSDEDE
jgi:hypothetical protein